MTRKHILRDNNKPLCHSSSTTTANSDIGLPPPPLTRVMGVGRQPQPYGGNVLEYGSCYDFVCCVDRFLLLPPCCWCECFEYLYCLACFCCCDFYVFDVCEFGVFLGWCSWELWCCLCCYVGCLQLMSVFLSMCLFVLCVLCFTVLVNCLLNAFAICVGELCPVCFPIVRECVSVLL